MAFVKLHGTILDSSVWSQPSYVRIVWITMLAMADQDGIVAASVDGLARRAVVSIEECEQALRIFQSPDPMSRDDTTGERIERVHGGWLILNHAAYRDRRTPQQIATAARVAKHRARKRGATGNIVTARNDLSPSEAEADAEAEGVVVAGASSPVPGRVPRSTVPQYPGETADEQAAAAEFGDGLRGLAKRMEAGQ